jgi:XRE family transcriptional regulator, aerobic/anaerobic benzoate catabolism transcriptional regulator
MLQPDLASSIAKNVRAWRTQRGLTRKQLASAAGVSERSLNELEHGSANPSIGVIAKVAEALGRAPSEASPSRRQTSTELQSLIEVMSASEQTAAAVALAGWLADQQRASKGIALLGLRGAGKSTLGKMLASRFNVPLVSVTREIERRAGMRRNEIFNLGGPNASRAMENDVVTELAGRSSKIVLETTGGIAGNSDVLSTIFARFKTVWLRASPDEHLARVAG